MVHVLAIAKGSRQSLEDYKSKMLLKTYPGMLPNNIFLSTCPNVRQFEFWEITVKTKHLPFLLKELAPYGLFGADAQIGSGKWWLNAWFKPFRWFARLKDPPVAVNKRKTCCPEWRDHVIVNLMGQSVLGDETTVDVMALGQRKYVEELHSHIEKQQWEELKPVFCEIEFWDIGLFWSQVGKLYQDLRPFGTLEAPAKAFSRQWFANFFLGFGRWITGIKAPPVYGQWMQDGKVIRKKDGVDITIVAEKKDEWLNGVEMV